MYNEITYNSITSMRVIYLYYCLREEKNVKKLRVTKWLDREDSDLIHAWNEFL